ncbi:MAG: ATP synthase subunit I [Proteobacteria bacterium]|nr:ATP synthase subunit I [Pseudomonadota bacterium]
MNPHPSLLEVRRVAFLLPVWQLLLGIIVSFIFFLGLGINAGIASFFGASIGVAGSLVFAFVIFGLGNQSPKNMTRQMFRAEAYKIMIVAGMFYLAFAKLGLSFLPVIVGFMATLIVFFVALLTVFR